MIYHFATILGLPQGEGQSEQIREFILSLIVEHRAQTSSGQRLSPVSASCAGVGLDHVCSVFEALSAFLELAWRAVIIGLGAAAYGPGSRATTP